MSRLLVPHISNHGLRDKDMAQILSFASLAYLKECFLTGYKGRTKCHYVSANGGRDEDRSKYFSL